MLWAPSPSAGCSASSSVPVIDTAVPLTPASTFDVSTSDLAIPARTPDVPDSTVDVSASEFPVSTSEAEVFTNEPDVPTSVPDVSLSEPSTLVSDPWMEVRLVMIWSAWPAMGLRALSTDPSVELMSAMSAGSGLTLPPAPVTAEFASARLVSMCSSDDTIPVRKPTTTSTTRMPIVTQVHIHPVSVFDPVRRGADTAAAVMALAPSPSARPARAGRDPVVDAAGVAVGGRGLAHDVAGVPLDGLGQGDRSVEVAVDLRDVVVDALGDVEDGGRLGVDVLGRPVDRAGAGIDTPGAAADGLGRRADRLGSAVDLHCAAVDRRRRAVDGAARAVDRAGRAVDRLGQAVDRLGQRDDLAQLALQRLGAVEDGAGRLVRPSQLDHRVGGGVDPLSGPGDVLGLVVDAVRRPRRTGQQRHADDAGGGHDDDDDGVRHCDRPSLAPRPAVLFMAPLDQSCHPPVGRGVRRREARPRHESAVQRRLAAADDGSPLRPAGPLHALQTAVPGDVLARDEQDRTQQEHDHEGDHHEDGHDVTEAGRRAAPSRAGGAPSAPPPANPAHANMAAPRSSFIRIRCEPWSGPPPPAASYEATVNL